MRAQDAPLKASASAVRWMTRYTKNLDCCSDDLHFLSATIPDAEERPGQLDSFTLREEYGCARGLVNQESYHKEIALAKEIWQPLSDRYEILDLSQKDSKALADAEIMSFLVKSLSASGQCKEACQEFQSLVALSERSIEEHMLVAPDVTALKLSSQKRLYNYSGYGEPPSSREWLNALKQICNALIWEHMKDESTRFLLAEEPFYWQLSKLYLAIKAEPKASASLDALKLQLDNKGRLNSSTRNYMSVFKSHHDESAMRSIWAL